MTHLKNMPVGIYNLSGQSVYINENASGELSISLQKGMYMLRVGNMTSKIVVY